MRKGDLQLRSIAACLAVGMATWACAPATRSDRLGREPTPPAPVEVAAEPLVVGFDLDDTLLFSSPAFDQAVASGVPRDSAAYWELVNAADETLSTVKQSTLRILRRHQARGDEVFVVTARHPHGVEPLLAFIEEAFAIAPERVFFETEGKTARIRQLGIAVFYGDSDSDIRAAQEAGAKAVRILRSPASTYRRNYDPGSLGEEIIEGSEN